VSVPSVSAGNYICIALTFVEKRDSMRVCVDQVLLSRDNVNEKYTTKQFTTKLVVPQRRTPSSLTVGSTSIFHVHAGQRIVARITHIDADRIIAGNTHTIVWQCIPRKSVKPWIGSEIDQKFICSDGCLRASGTITSTE